MPPLLTFTFYCNQNTDVGEVVFQVSASDKDSSDHHYNTVYFKIAGGDKVSGEKIIHSVVQYFLNLIIPSLSNDLYRYILTCHIIASISPDFIGYF